MKSDTVSWKKYVDTLHKEINAEIEASRKSALIALDGVRREQDLLATRDYETANKIQSELRDAALVAERKFEQLQSQVDMLVSIKTDLAIQVVQVSALRNEMQLIESSSDKAIAKSEAATEKRFQSVNAFREQLAEQATTFMPREVAEAQMIELRKKLDELTARVDTAAGKSLGANAVVGLIVAAVTVISAVILGANGIFQ